MSSLARQSTAPATSTGSVRADVAVPADATDTISAMRWSPVANHLAAASWDGKVRIYDVAADGTARGVAMITAEGPVLSCDWSKDGTMVAGVGADRKLHVLHASSSQTMSIAAHSAAVRAVRFLDSPAAGQAPIVATGSWDQTVSYWDLRQATAPVATLQCGQRVYAMDTAGPLLVVATPDPNIRLVDVSANPAAVVRAEDTKLRNQVKAVAASPDGKYWCAGSIEGRCSSGAVDENEAKKYNFSWRCHRSEPDSKKVVNVYAVNDLCYNRGIPTLVATGGSDGTFSFWDVHKHVRLRQFPNVGGAVTATAFNSDGRVFAYAVGYDWSKGFAHNSPQYPLKLMLHPVAEDEVKGASSK